MKKKGFTLVELLAVIVILAIIALIAIPLIGNVIEKAKIGSLESSVNGLVESANMYYANETIKGGIITETIFDFEDGEQVSDKKLEYKGKVYNGKLILHASGEVAVCIDDEEHYAYKNKDTDEIVSGIGTCVYDGTTGDFTIESDVDVIQKKCDEDKKELQEQIDELTEQINNLQNEINEKEDAINSLQSNLEANQNEIATLEGEKAELKEALNKKNEELAELNETLGKVTATASDVLSGKTILTSSGIVTGSLLNNGSVSKALNAGGSYTIPKGYHDGTGKVTANSLSSQTSGTAVASQILKDKTAWVNGSKVTGTMSNKSGSTVTASTVTQSGTNALITIPSSGYYSTSSKISVPISVINSNLTGNSFTLTSHLRESTNITLQFAQDVTIEASTSTKSLVAYVDNVKVGSVTTTSSSIDVAANSVYKLASSTTTNVTLTVRF